MKMMHLVHKCALFLLGIIAVVGLKKSFFMGLWIYK